MQDIVNRLFAGLDARAFQSMPYFLCTEDIQPPKGFEGMWSFIVEKNEASAHPWLNTVAEKHIQAVVIVTRLPSSGPECAREMLTNHLGPEPIVQPNVLLLPVGETCNCATHTCLSACARHLVTTGAVDDICWGEPAGFKLAFEIQAKMRQASKRLDEFEEKLRSQSAALESFEDITATLNMTRWQYLPSRLLHSIPPVRDDLHEDDGSIGGFRIGQEMVRGLLGGTHIATREQGRALSCSMLVVEKENRTFRFLSLRMIDHHLRLMQDLSHFRHPNVSHLLAVFHTPKRLCVCTELSGAQTLYGRLRRRDRPPQGAGRLPLAGDALIAIMKQASSAAAHLHSSRICHRDIKPENFSINEQGDRVQVKLGGFELARTQVEDEMNGSSCGTMPFAAPEMILSKMYDGLAADVWSLGVVFMEVICGIRSIERALIRWYGASVASQKGANTNLEAFQAAARQIWTAFSQKDIVERLVMHAVPEAQDLRPQLLPLLQNTLRTTASERPSAASVQKALP